MNLEEHKKRIEEMKAAEKRAREWLERGVSWATTERLRASDVRLLLERIDAYEASITWHTDCLNCPKLYDQIYKMDQHTIPKLVALEALAVKRLRIAVEALELIAETKRKYSDEIAKEALTKLELP